jgi:hypothetical protein
VLVVRYSGVVWREEKSEDLVVCIESLSKDRCGKQQVCAVSGLEERLETFCATYVKLRSWRRYGIEKLATCELDRLLVTLSNVFVP